MKKSMIIAAAAATMALAGCQKDTLGGGDAPETTGNEISFRALTDKTQTRATLVDGNNIRDFRVYAVWNNPDAASPSTFNYMNAVSVTRDMNGASTWTYNPIKYWPKKGTVDFFAFSPAGSVNVYNVTFSSTNMVIDYYVPLRASSTKKAEDFLIARTAGLTGGQVELTFEHALALATFSAKNVSTAATYTITSIQLVNLWNNYGIGIPGGGFAAGARDKVYTAELPAATVLPAGPTAEFIELLGPNEGMMVMQHVVNPGAGVDEDDVNDGTEGTGTPDGIPDDFEVAGKSYLVVTYGVTDQTGGVVRPAGTKAYFPLNVHFLRGQAYDFQITLGDNLNPVSFTVDVNPWPVANDQPIPQP